MAPQEYYRLQRSSRESQAYPVGQLHDAVESLLGNDLVNWGAPGAEEQIKKQFNLKNSPLYRIIATMSVSKGLETTNAINLIANHLLQEVPKTGDMIPDKFKTQWQKYYIFLNIYFSLELLARADKDFYQPSVQKLRSAIEKHAGGFEFILQDATLEDFVKYCESMYFLAATVSQKAKGQIPFAGESESFEKGKEEIEQIRVKIHEGIGRTEKETWTRLKDGWNWQQINSIISMLPEIKSRIVISSLYIAIFNNLNNLKEKPTQSPDMATTQGLLYLMSCKWDLPLKEEQMAQFREDEPELYNSLETDEVKFENFCVPRKLLPAIFLDYMNVLSQSSQKAAIEKAWELNSAVASYKVVYTEWFLGLLVLANVDNSYKTCLNEFLSKFSQFGPEVYQIINDEIPGKIFLTPNGKLRLKEVTGAYPIYKSEAQELTPPVKKPPAAKVEEPKIPANQLQTDIIQTYDFIGDVAVLDNDKALAILQELENSQVFFEDELLEKFDLLTKSFEQTDLDKTYIYHNPLNPADATLREAKKLGIETVVISGAVVSFIFPEKNRRVAITGTLNNEGWLELEVEDAKHNNIWLALNNIALELMSKKQQESNPQITKDSIDQWNRLKRGDLPRLTLENAQEANVLIALRVDGKTYFALESNHN